MALSGPNEENTPLSTEVFTVTAQNVVKTNPVALFCHSLTQLLAGPNLLPIARVSNKQNTGHFGISSPLTHYLSLYLLSLLPFP